LLITRYSISKNQTPQTSLDKNPGSDQKNHLGTDKQIKIRWSRKKPKKLHTIGEVANNMGCSPFWPMIIFNRKEKRPTELEPAKNNGQ
jgi:hypothetical protein